MDPLVQRLAEILRDAIEAIPAHGDGGRIDTVAICDALSSAIPALEAEFGAPAIQRYSGCNVEAKRFVGVDGRHFRSIEYLWDYSISRFGIPQAIEQNNAHPIPLGEHYELLFVAESELGDAAEVCRDLLKLLEARTQVRCLVYTQRDARARAAFEARLLRVMNNHAHFARDPGRWLFLGIEQNAGALSCHVATLNNQNNAIVLVPRPPQANAIARE